MKNWDSKQILIVVLLVGIILTLIGGVTLLSYKFKDVELRYEQLANTKQIPGPRGENGITSSQTIVSYLPGKDGENGKDAPPPTQEQVDESVAKYLESHPVKDGESIQGPKGDPGTPGLLIFVRQTLLGDLQCKYSTDLGWSPIEECSQ